MKAAQAILDTAREQGLRHFFGIPGSGSPLELIEAGRQTGVEFVNVSHESSAAIAAASYGFAKKAAGLAMSIRGVGAANLAGGVANVFFERLPLVAVCEAPPISGQNTESVQQCDQLQLFSGVAGYQATLNSEHAHEMIRDAFAKAISGRPSPSVLHLPAGLADVEGGPFPKPKETCARWMSVNGSELQKVKDFLAEHRRIAILAGADVVRASATAELQAVAKALEAAVLATMDARGVFPESDPRWTGVFLGLFNPNVIESKVFQQSDAVLLVGVDAMMTHVPWKTSLPTCELLPRADYSSMSAPTLRLNGDLKSLLGRLASEAQPGFSEADVQRLRASVLPYFKRPAKAGFAAQDIIEITRELLPNDGLLLSETGAFVCMLEHLWPVNRPGTFFGTSGGRTMGLMIPAALGARLADRQTPMVGLGADGSLLMRLGELEVFARTRIALPLVIINDQALGTMKARQKSRGLPDCGLDFHGVDFASVARSFGLEGVIANDPEEFRGELTKALKSKRTVLIDARVDPQVYQNSFGPTIGDLSQWQPS